MNFVNEASGFLFVGDPHICSRKPGRRKDDDFSATILGKMAEAIRIANEKNYVVVILGDMFEHPREESEGVKTRLTRILRQSKHQVVYLLGNHCKHHAKLSDDDSVALLESSGVIDVIKESGAYGVFDFGGVRIGLGGTPHGEEIPKDVSGLFENCRSVVWLTHHDLEFEGAYPNSLPTHEIEGCKLVVNGHMHLTKKAKKEGQTTWFNPGNINRQAVDAINHTPRVFGFAPTGKIEAIELTHKKDVFDLTGRLVSSIKDEGSEDELESAFVQLIQSEDSADFSQTDDGAVIRELIETKFEGEDTGKALRGHIINLYRQVVDEAA